MLLTGVDAPLQLLMREFFNGVAVVVTFLLALMALVRVCYEFYMWWQYRHVAENTVTFREFWRRPVVHVGFGIMVYFMSECIQRYWVFVLLRKNILRAPDLKVWETLWWLPVAATALSIIGALGIVRALAPEGWDRIVVAISAVLALALLAELMPAFLR